MLYWEMNEGVVREEVEGKRQGAQITINCSRVNVMLNSDEAPASAAGLLCSMSLRSSWSRLWYLLHPPSASSLQFLCDRNITRSFPNVLALV